MTRPVKRSYDASGRQAGAQQRRRRILDAATELFVARGYEGTTMSAIADRAGVALDTVYTAVGTKSVVLNMLVELALSGGDEPIEAEQRDYVKAIRAEPSARRKLELYAAAVRAIHERLGPIFLVLDTASKSDPQLAEVWHTIAERRAANMKRFALELAATGELRDDVDPDVAADVLWAFNAAEFYDLLVHRRGWTPEQFERWLGDAWPRLLLAGPAQDL